MNGPSSHGNGESVLWGERKIGAPVLWSSCSKSCALLCSASRMFIISRGAVVLTARRAPFWCARRCSGVKYCIPFGCCYKSPIKSCYCHITLCCIRRFVRGFLLPSFCSESLAAFRGPGAVSQLRRSAVCIRGRSGSHENLDLSFHRKPADNFPFFVFE